MLKLRFTGGGPMDGARLLSNGPAEEWFAVEGGRYRLCQTVSLPDAVGDWPTVFYEWVSGPDHW